jgi:hypothetical protein
MGSLSGSNKTTADRVKGHSPIWEKRGCPPGGARSRLPTAWPAGTAVAPPTVAVPRMGLQTASSGFHQPPPEEKRPAPWCTAPSRRAGPTSWFPTGACGTCSLHFRGATAPPNTRIFCLAV